MYHKLTEHSAAANEQTLFDDAVLQTAAFMFLVDGLAHCCLS
jgi:hypothetical protein